MKTGKFITPLDYRDLDGENWQLLGHLDYYCPSLKGIIRAQKGFVTDLASIPRFFHRIIPKSGPHNYAAVIHDWLYRNGGVVCLIRESGEMVAIRLSRKACDDIFREAMKASKPDELPKSKTPAWQRVLIYTGVRAGGFVPWNDVERRLSGTDISNPCAE